MIERKRHETHPALEYGKVPPSAVDLEEAVLSALISESHSLIKIKPILKPESFYKDHHQKIYKAILSLDEKREPIDLLTVTSELRRMGELEYIGGAYALAVIHDKVSSSAHIEYHARIIDEAYIGREVIQVASNAIKDAFEDSCDKFEVRDKLLSEAAKIGFNSTNKTNDTSSLYDSFIERRNLQDSGKIIGIPTGINEFDRLTGGLQNTDLIVIGSYPSNFKSALALNILTNAAESGYCGKMYSLEMSELQLFVRQLGMISGENPKDILINGLYDREKVNNAALKLKSHSTKYSDKIFHINELKSDIRKSVSLDGVKFAIIDYIQLVQYDAKSRTEGVGGVANSLKALCNELNIPIILISQLTKPQSNGTAVRMPSGDMLKESSDIFAAADIVLLPSCPYNPPFNIVNDTVSFVNSSGVSSEMSTMVNGNKLLVMNMEKGRSYGIGKWFNYVDSSMKIKNSIQLESEYTEQYKPEQIKPNNNFDNEKPF